MLTPRPHLVLMGDSIFDNAIYVPGEPAVIDHLRTILPPGARATLIAHDGDVTADVAGQLDHLPADATHIVVSVGGNDALHALGCFSIPAETVNEALAHLSIIRSEFQRDYQRMLRNVLAWNLPLAVCTIYDAVPGLSVEAKTALSIFNDLIVREAFANRLPVIDLRQICTEESDYSAISPIEPSAAGGRKIAEAVCRCVRKVEMHHA